MTVFKDSRQKSSNTPLSVNYIHPVGVYCQRRNILRQLIVIGVLLWESLPCDETHVVHHKVDMPAAILPMDTENNLILPCKILTDAAGPYP